jgi:molybdopterin/thiamine biosynthesis adenylyltransferase
MKLNLECDAPGIEALPAAELTDIDRATYECQMQTPEFGEREQRALKRATALVTRVGGIGTAAAHSLAAAGVGRLILCDRGVETAARRLKELNPRLKIEAMGENIDDENASRLAAKADVLLDCAPLFRERLALNRAAVQQRKPLVECAMVDLDAQFVTVIHPGKTPCLACLYPTPPAASKQQSPVFGAAAGMIGSLGAMEAIKVLAGVESPLAGQLLYCDLRSLSFQRVGLKRRHDCNVCGTSR